MASYHHQALDLLKIMPPSSQNNRRNITAFEGKPTITLPSAIEEWYLLDPDLTLLAKIATPHRPIKFDRALQLSPEFMGSTEAYNLLPVLLENQGVWTLAVDVDDGDNPRVLFRYNEDGEPWRLHSHSFSDWIYALTWDYLNVEQLDNWLFTGREPDASRLQLLNLEMVGPETYVVNAYFKGTRFQRAINKGERITVVFA